MRMVLTQIDLCNPSALSLSITLILMIFVCCVEKVLPFGAYCSFALHETLTDCGWTNTVTNRSHGSAPAPTWELRKVAGDEITATAVFHPRTGLIDRAVMRTIKTFNPIPRFHSLPHSMFYNSCSVSVWKIHSSGNVIICNLIVCTDELFIPFSDSEFRTRYRDGNRET